MAIQVRSAARIQRAAVYVGITVIVATSATNSALALQKKPTTDSSHCACVCDTGNEITVLEYQNPGSCGVLNGKTCNAEVNQQGATVVRTGSLSSCGPRVSMPLQSIPDLGPVSRPVRR